MVPKAVFSYLWFIVGPARRRSLRRVVLKTFASSRQRKLTPQGSEFRTKASQPEIALRSGFHELQKARLRNLLSLKQFCKTRTLTPKSRQQDCPSSETGKDGWCKHRVFYVSHYETPKNKTVSKKTATGKLKNLKLIHTCTTSNNHNFQNHIGFKTTLTTKQNTLPLSATAHEQLTVVLYDTKNTGNRVEVLSQKNRTTNVSIKQWRDQLCRGRP